MSERVEYVVRCAHGGDYWRTYDTAEAARRCRDANNNPNDKQEPTLAMRGPWTVIKRTITEEAINDA